MPVVSQAQRRFMYATEEGKTGVDPKVGKDFVDASHGLKGLPEHVGGFKGAMQHHGFAKGDGKHKRHPATSGHTAFGPKGNRFSK